MKRGTPSWIAVCVVVGLVVYCVAFITTHEHIVLNRYVDSWWHIAVADEYAYTGAFAKDPFFTAAPPFAQFGLLDWATGMLSDVTGCRAQVLFPYVLSLSVAASLMCSFAAGYWINRRSVEGVVCMLAWLIVFGRHTVIGLGMPFAAALPPLHLLLVSLWTRRGMYRFGVWGAVWRGLLLGLVTDMHVFVGLVGCVSVAVTVICCLAGSRQARDMGWAGPTRIIFLGSVMAAAFAVTSWRWIWLHLSLRSALSGLNAHNKGEYGVETPFLVVLAAIMLMLLTAALLNKRARMLAASYSALCLVSGLLCIPAVNAWLADRTSWYMARRLPLLAPVGVAFALGWSVCIDGVGLENVCRRRVWALRATMASIMLGLFLPSLRQWALFHRHMWITADYDEHPQQHLVVDLGDHVRGLTVLSDPTTSYFLRGMLGARVVTVTPGVASPAVDYREKDRRAVRLLAGGPDSQSNCEVDAVVVNRRSDATARFAGIPDETIATEWQSAGWGLVVDTRDVLLLSK